MFTDPAARKAYVDWEKEAADMLGRFRAAAARRLDDPDFTDLIERLHQDSPEVRIWWPRFVVRPVGGGTKHLHHPALMDRDLDARYGRPPPQRPAGSRGR